ncbi:XdhC family protein [Martelella mediterranea]|nr:XdhC family protein [Martelella mediterranea]
MLVSGNLKSGASNERSEALISAAIRRTSPWKAAVCETEFAFHLLLEEDCALALIVGIEGPAYRPVGAAMAITADGRRSGNLSSGCIEADIGLHALETLKTGRPKRLVYGTGSPFGDLRLPCGGRLEILILPRPDKRHIAALASRLKKRQSATLYVDCARNQLVFDEADASLTITITPDIRFLVFGKGSEARVFSSMARQAGYPTRFFSPDASDATAGDIMFQHLKSAQWPSDLAVDQQTAIAFFFHDHDYALPLLAGALRSNAFYIGAQGSRKTAGRQRDALHALRIPSGMIDKLVMPIGLVRSVRDPRALAISVLADVIEHARGRS